MTELNRRYGRTRREPGEDRIRLVRTAGQAIIGILGVGSSVLSFTALGLTWTAVVITGLVLALAVSIVANVVSVADARLRGRRPRQIAFLTPSSGGEPFYTELLTGLVRNASLALGQDYIILPSMPTQSFETVSIWALFASLEDRQVHIDGMIFIPDDPDDHFDELVGFHEHRGDVPLVLLDVYFDLANCDSRTRSRLPSFVGGDELLGGRLAAEIAIQAVGESPPTVPVILVINGGTAPWERQRTTAFRRRIRRSWPSARFVETPNIAYSREGARVCCLSIMKSMAHSGRAIQLDVIFASNDDMAIGSRSAVLAMVRGGWRFVRPPQIVGYDGISEIREYIANEDIYIAGTVDARLAEQAQKAMLLMHKLVRSGQRRSEVVLVAPLAIQRSDHLRYDDAPF